jgi:hypothetical protein
MINEILRVESNDSVALLKIEATVDDFLDTILMLEERGHKVTVITEKEYNSLRAISVPSYSAKKSTTN